jgi:hypothetical protein
MRDGKMPRGHCGVRIADWKALLGARIREREERIVRGEKWGEIRVGEEYN